MENITNKAKNELRIAFKKRRIGFLIILAFIPIGSLIVEVGRSSFWVGIFIFSYILFIGYFLFRVLLYKCPRCKKIFLGPSSRIKFVTSRCYYCGLSVEENDPKS
jgi:hypothetical protein